MEDVIVNRVAQSPLVTLDLETLYTPGERVVVDIKDQLFQGLILKEKDFREYVKAANWAAYKGKLVAITCSADAIIPTWAFMLLSTALQPYAQKVVFGSLEDLEEQLFFASMNEMDWNVYIDARVVVKGCSNVIVPVSVYVEATNRLLPLARSIMYGEPCSTVPLYKRLSSK
jgi:hypothetical protein